MAKVTHLGEALPDDPIYGVGAAVGGKRFYRSSEGEKGGGVVLAKLPPGMTREQKLRNLIKVLEKSGIEVRPAPQRGDGRN